MRSAWPRADRSSATSSAFGSAPGRRDGGWVDRVNYQTLGVTDGDANRVDTYVLRAALAWAPIENLTITPGIDYQNRDQHNYDDYWVSISNPSAGSFSTARPTAWPTRPLLPADPEDRVGRRAGAVISNTAYYDRLELVNGYSGTLYNLSYFQHYLDPNPSLSIFGYPSDPQGVPCTNNCQASIPLLTATGPNVPGLPNYLATTITNAQQNFTQEFRIQSNDPASRLQWTAGVFYAFNRQRSNEEIHDPELPAITQYLWNETRTCSTPGARICCPTAIDYDQRHPGARQQIALFADATYRHHRPAEARGRPALCLDDFDFINPTTARRICSTTAASRPSSTGNKSEQPFTPKFS
jgi:iron complex outermembrane receptor protein